jgi:hypothetical protein
LCIKVSSWIEADCSQLSVPLSVMQRCKRMEKEDEVVAVDETPNEEVACRKQSTILLVALGHRRNPPAARKVHDEAGGKRKSAPGEMCRNLGKV